MPLPYRATNQGRPPCTHQYYDKWYWIRWSYFLNIFFIWQVLPVPVDLYILFRAHVVKAIHTSTSVATLLYLYGDIIWENSFWWKRWPILIWWCDPVTLSIKAGRFSEIIKLIWGRSYSRGTRWYVHLLAPTLFLMPNYGIHVDLFGNIIT